ncbi:MAG: SMC-Scp complex subunit ScpB [archaeon]|nr:SMC-Scp complex subunit ScpB [archaeon]
MDSKKAKRVIEAALFTSPGTVNMRELAKITDLNVAEVRVLVNDLIHDYEAKDTSIEIVDEPDGVRMAVKEEYEDFVGHMAAAPELHRGMMKTLAFIAYKQPVKQSDVINFRNSKAYEHIKLLKEKGFIKKEKKGITYIITTTPKFREYFGKDAGKGKLEQSQAAAPAKKDD